MALWCLLAKSLAWSAASNEVIGSVALTRGNFRSGNQMRPSKLMVKTVRQIGNHQSRETLGVLLAGVGR